MERGGGQQEGINRSHRGSRGTDGGRDGCLEVTSEQRDETERGRRKPWDDKQQRWIARGNAERKTRKTKGEERGNISGCVAVLKAN